ncbi:hypothetical protein N474_01845 [Pseudoalteromonas luteoviolacea CPMOR-2]|uniref:hypothetical protein n=1 Tax=Pseudoalteromonas luteoviolacea TaxID=43657 RepID=UPI0007B03C9C|nr:hypothetical protein [Pseudoalteromonas luteoviolacea]KZN54486.1 hypothetical protein N474_01845 [Pseudoalteromonas luteoviolacea CPMOR-2]
MKVFKFLIVLAFSFVSQAYAIGVESAKVLTIQTYTNGTVAVTTDKQHFGPSSCNSKAKYIVPATDKGLANTLSVLLTAKVASMPVTIYLHDSVCSSGYPMITSIIIE